MSRHYVPGCIPASVRRAVEQAGQPPILFAGEPPEYYLEVNNHFLDGDTYGDNHVSSNTIRPLAVQRLVLTGNMTDGAAAARRLIWNGSGYEPIGDAFTLYDFQGRYPHAIEGNFGYFAVDPVRQAAEVVSLNSKDWYYGILSGDLAYEGSATVALETQANDGSLSSRGVNVTAYCPLLDNGFKLPSGARVKVAIDLDSGLWNADDSQKCPVEA